MSFYLATDSRQYLQKKRRKRKKIVLFVVLSCILIVAACCGVYWRKLTERFADIATKRAEAQITYAVNESVAEVFGSSTYADFVQVEADTPSGKVHYVAADSQTINMFALQTAVYVQNKLSRLCLSCEVPFGTLAGFILLPELKPNFAAEFSSVDVVNCKINSRFLSAGVNQTLHRIFVDVAVQTELLIPGRFAKISVTVPVLICENIIVGDVPPLLWHTD